DVSVAEALEGNLFACKDVLQMKRLMGALDDLGRAIVAANSFDQLVVRFAGALGDEDVTRPAQIAGRLAQRPSREKMLVSKGRLPIDQDNVEPVFEVKVLETVVEEERIGLEFLNRVEAALHPVLVHENNDILQVVRQHVRLVTRRQGIEEECSAVRN